MESSNSPRNNRKRSSGYSLFIIVGLIVFLIYAWRSPPNTFDPLCTYTVNAHVSADVEISGQTFTANVVYQNSQSRRWISQLNSAGCTQKNGNALVYKLPKDRLLIFPSHLCYPAEKLIQKTGHVDILNACPLERARQNRGFFIDSSENPRRWRHARNGSDYEITRMTATTTWDDPSDNIETVAPKLLSSRFEYGRHIAMTWSKSPEALIPYSRRRPYLPKGDTRKLSEFDVQFSDFRID